MARRKRKSMQEHAYVAQRASDRILVQIRHLMDIFAPAHQEFMPLLQSLAQMQVIFQSTLGDLFVHAWGRRPPEFPDLANPGFLKEPDPDIDAAESRIEEARSLDGRQETVKTGWGP